MAALPYMQFYVADYLADTMHLTMEQHGAYLLLMMNYWQTGKPLPDDDERLQCICKANAEQWQNLRPRLQEFFQVTDGYWYHKRIEADLEKVHAKSESARKAAQSRHKQANSVRTHSERKANAEQTDMRTGCHTDTDTDTDKHSPPSGDGASTAGGSAGKPDYQGVVDLYNEILGELFLPKVKTLTDTRKRLIKARWNQRFGEADQGAGNNKGSGNNTGFWERYFKYVAESEFLTGRKPGTKWAPNFDWLLKESNMVKVIEGAYHITDTGPAPESIARDRGKALREIHRQNTERNSPFSSRPRHSGFNEIDYSAGLIADAPDGQANF